MINITTVDFYLKDSEITNTSLEGRETLLDADVVIFNPAYYHEIWKEKLVHYDDNSTKIFSPHSDQIRNVFEVRKNEVETLLEKGKIIISFLYPLRGFSGQIGDKSSYDIVTNYRYLPLPLQYFHDNLRAGRSGRRKHVRHNKKKNPFSTFFYAFKEQIEYEAYFDFDAEDNADYFILNKSNRALGAIHKFSNGLIVNLPVIDDFDHKKFIGVIRQCAKSFFDNKDETPAPKWIESYSLPGEKLIKEKLNKIEAEIKSLQEKEADIVREQIELTNFKKLLYSNGKELEKVTLEAFKLFGFEVENRTVNDLEHDIIFHSKEGRGIAEIEGKDKDAINISKLDQLNRAVDEDFALTDNYPQGVLIGNHYRFLDPEKREAPFTEKVHIVAKKKSYGLLSTLEIYNAIQKILENPDIADFKRKCREQILNTTGTISLNK